MTEKRANTIRDKVDELKSSMNPKMLFIITSDDKILFASAPVIQILKMDPVGTSFVPLVHQKDRKSLKQAMDNLESGDVVRTLQLGTQFFLVEMNTKRESIEGRVIGLTIVTKITIVPGPVKGD